MKSGQSKLNLIYKMKNKITILVVAALSVALASCAVSTPWGDVSVKPAASLDVNVSR